MHLWWARRPLAAARAVLFSQLVNDPGYETGRGFTRGVNKKDAALERERLFAIIRELVKWENTNNDTVLEAARREIKKSWEETCRLNAKHPQAATLFDPSKLPAFHDPFAGGGAIPLEAQRLGMESHASDLNPVAVLINKAMIEIPPKFSGRAPVGPVPLGEKQAEMHEDWSGTRGLAEDVRRYGHWMRERAKERIGQLYPNAEITESIAIGRSDLKPLVGQKLTVIAWLWARTVRSPNPAYASVEVPLASTFLLSTKAGRESWVEPVVDGHTYRFEIRSAAAGHGKPPAKAKSGTKSLGRGSNFNCLVSDSPISGDYIKGEGQAGRLGARLMAIVVEGPRGRIYLPPTEEDQKLAESARPTWRPEGEVPSRLTGGTCYNYGLKTWGDLFTPRQLVALTTLSDLVSEAREFARAAAIEAGMPDDGKSLDNEGSGAAAYADGVATMLGIAVSRTSNTINSQAVWSNSRDQSVNLFSRQAIPMTWDFPEVNPFAGAAGDFASTTASLSKSLPTRKVGMPGFVQQQDAQRQRISQDKIVSTDPPYYDNIAYADLSDFFYVWMRRSLKGVFPALFATMSVPKAEELVAASYRHGGREQAEAYFLAGMSTAMQSLAEQSSPAFPVTIYYAFKQSETSNAGTSSTGWETFLAAVLKAGLAVSGTWPMRTERPTGVKVATNALASSIILVCRRRAESAQTVSRKEFLRELKEVLKEALEAMLGGEGNVSPIAPVDLAQAAIGPGMAVFSQYEAVLEANGKPMSVHTALTLINKQVDEALGGENFDPDTNFCLGWFQDVGWSTGDYGKANTLAQAKATSVEGAQSSGVLEAKSGKVKLLRAMEYDAAWDPRGDNRTPVWEALHQLMRALNQGGESVAGALLARMPERSSDIRRLAFWLYTLCERKGWADDARGYNELVSVWHAIEAASHDVGQVGAQSSLDI